MQAHMLSLAGSGATRNALTKGMIEDFDVPAPDSTDEQRAIAHILGTLDDKIELNRRMNETLEGMAQALFKSWFVDFDPVIDNALKAGNPIPDELAEKAQRRQAVLNRANTPTLPDDVLNLFPDSFEDSDLGPIPKGWRATTLGHFIEIHDSKRIPLNKKQRSERNGPYPYYGAASIMDYVDDYLFDGVYVLAGEDGSVIKDDGTPVLQYVWGKFWVNNHAHVLRGKNGISSEHLLLFLRQVDIRAFVTGAVQLKISQKNLKSIPFLMPSNETSARFGETVVSGFEAIRHNTDESDNLARLRDTLLPKLISGELRVPDVEKFVELLD